MFLLLDVSVLAALNMSLVNQLDSILDQFNNTAVSLAEETKDDDVADRDTISISCKQTVRVPLSIIQHPKELLHMWTWHHEHSTSPPEVLENGVPLMVQSPHLQQLLSEALNAHFLGSFDC